MKSAFVVQHLHLLSDEQEDIKLIGVYRSLEAARAAVDRVKSKPGFCDFPRILDPLNEDAVQGFYIDEYTLDKDHWPDGFISV